MSKRVEVGLIGAGGIASRHLATLMGFPDVVVTAISDPVKERAEALASGMVCTPYSDWRAMLRHADIDALFICTPPFAHGDPELSAAARGLPFFVEKPIAADLETAERIGEAIERADLITAVGYHWRYLDTVEEAQRRLADNPARLVLGYWLDSTPPADWWRQSAQSGGQLIEQTTHIFDLARLLVGEVEEVSAMSARSERKAFGDGDIHDVSAVNLRFASGAVGTIASTCLLDWRHRVELQLYAEGMAIELSEFELMVDVGQGRPVRRAEGNPFVREARDFIDAVLDEENRIRVPYAEALKTHRLAVAATRSAQEGRPLALAAA